MDNDESGEAPVNRRIALGLTKFLVKFAARRNALIWTEFAISDPLNWRFILLELADDPGTTICFNLHRVDVQIGLLRAATARATPTDWELLQIYEHDSWWPRIEWWDEETPESNPFDREPEP